MSIVYEIFSASSIAAILVSEHQMAEAETWR